MSEIHNRTGQHVYLDIYGGLADVLPTAVLTRPDGSTRNMTVVEDNDRPEGVDDRYYAVLTMADTSINGFLKITWDFSIESVDTDKIDRFEVITPYLTINEVKRIYPEATDEEAIELEASVRHIINAHTGQDFGYHEGTITVEGHGEKALRLPKRLIEITGMSTLTAVLQPQSSIIVSDGWYLKKGWSHEVSAIESDSLYWPGGYGGVPANDHDDDGIWTLPVPGEPGYEKAGHGVIINAPGYGTTPTPWKNDYPFNITGRWGYESVPGPVIEAAKLLVNDYACQEIAWRDRYLESIKAADWRLQFSSRAWDSTGNVRADQLLSEYVLLDWALV